MDTSVNLLTKQLHRNRDCVAQLHVYTKKLEADIVAVNADIRAYEEANAELETAISKLKENI